MSFCFSYTVLHLFLIFFLIFYHDLCVFDLRKHFARLAPIDQLLFEFFFDFSIRDHGKKFLFFLKSASDIA